MIRLRSHNQPQRAQKRAVEDVMFRHLPVFAAMATLMGGFAAYAEQASYGTYPMIVDEPDPRPDPYVVNGCELKPGTSCPGVDLRHADLRGLNLNGADLSGANLNRADMKLVELKGANLSGATLLGSDLSLGQLQGADFSNADLTGANMDFSRLAGADMSNANMTAVSLEAAWAPKARFVGTTLVSANLMEAKFYEADFGEAKLEGNSVPFTVWEGVNMVNCTGCPVDW